MKGMDWLAGGTLLLVVSAGIALQWAGVKQIWRAVASRQWPQTQGIVRESGAERIVFAYRVNGEEYETETLQIGQTEVPDDSSEAELLRLRYQPGTTVPVSYDPSDPASAVVRPGFHADALWLPVAGLAVTLAGTMFLAFYFSIEGRIDGFVIGMSIFATVFTLWGAAMLWFGAERLYCAYASQSWPVAPGEILYRGFDSSTTTSENEDGETIETTSYSTSLVYAFEVSGRRHYASLRRFGQLAGASAEWADGIAERYPPGAKVLVSHHPDDPDLAVLEPGVNSEAYYLPGAGLAVFLFSVAVWLSGIPALTKQPAAIQRR